MNESLQQTNQQMNQMDIQRAQLEEDVLKYRNEA